MKTIGLLGGMSPESTIDYYQRINAGIHRERGGHCGARMLLYSANLEEVFGWLGAGEYQSLGEHLGAAAHSLQEGGAEFVLMACNTVHLVAPQIASRLDVPFIHIADVLAEHLVKAEISRVGLLGTRLTMDAPFYRSRLSSYYGIEMLVPQDAAKEEVDRIVREELCFHHILPSSRESLILAAQEMCRRGAQGIVLGCTELGLLLETETVAGVPIFDTAALHAERAVDLALGHIRLPTRREKAA